ncbi:MAG: filamentous hemagglutinin N-terminal domain-containing protein, partial [Rhodospirillaceae bacterium]
MIKRQGKTMTNSNRHAVIETGALSSDGAKPRGRGVRQRLLGSTALAGVWGLVPLLAALGIAGTSYAGPPAPTQLPTGGQVVAGSAKISQSGAAMTVNQSSQRAVVNWQSFNVGSAASVTFNQPSSSSATLNRVLDSNPSQINGRVSANGQLFFTNPNGVYFGPGSSVDVGGLVATTHSISNADFMAGKTTLERNGATGSVVNEGTLTAGLGGYIALLAPEVRNQGVIVAKLGTVALAAGETYELQFEGNNTLADIRVTPATIKALVENRSAVKAPGGLIILSAQAVDRMQGGVVNNSGSLEATGLVNDGGRIILGASDSISHTGTIKADAAPNSAGNGGTVSVIADLANPASQTKVGGSISARGGTKGGNGGAVETSASTLHIADAARVDTAAPKGLAGSWVLDPTNFAITAGTAAQTASGIGAQTLEAALAAGNVTIATSATAHGSDLGDITVNADVLWSANNLTLTAANTITINARMTAMGTSTLTLNPGGSGTLKVSFDNSGRFAGSINFPGRSGTGILT